MPRGTCESSISTLLIGMVEHINWQPSRVFAEVSRIFMTSPEITLRAHMPHMPVRHENGALMPRLSANSSKVPFTAFHVAAIHEVMNVPDCGLSGGNSFSCAISAGGASVTPISCL